MRHSTYLHSILLGSCSFSIHSIAVRTPCLCAMVGSGKRLDSSFGVKLDRDDRASERTRMTYALVGVGVGVGVGVVVGVRRSGSGSEKSEMTTKGVSRGKGACQRRWNQDIINEALTSASSAALEAIVAFVDWNILRWNIRDWRR